MRLPERLLFLVNRLAREVVVFPPGGALPVLHLPAVFFREKRRKEMVEVGTDAFHRRLFDGVRHRKGLRVQPQFVLLFRFGLAHRGLGRHLRNPDGRTAIEKRLLVRTDVFREIFDNRHTGFTFPHLSHGVGIDKRTTLDGTLELRIQPQRIFPRKYVRQPNRIFPIPYLRPRGHARRHT